MFLPEPTGTNPYERGAPEAPLPKAPVGGAAEGSGAGESPAVGLELAEHEEPFAWPEGTVEVDTLGRNIEAVQLGRVAAEHQRKREESAALGARRRRDWALQGFLRGAFILGVWAFFTLQLHRTGNILDPRLLLVATSGGATFAWVSRRSLGRGQASLWMTCTWLLGAVFIQGRLLSLVLSLFAIPGVIALSQAFALEHEDPLR